MGIKVITHQEKDCVLDANTLKNNYKKFHQYNFFKKKPTTKKIKTLENEKN